MNKIPGVIVLDGPEVVTGTGQVVKAPAPPEPRRPEVTLDRLAAALGDNGQVFLTAREPVWDVLISQGEAGNWTVSGNEAWYTARRGQMRLRIGKLPDIPIENDPLIGPDPVTTAIRHQVFARLTGVSFYGDGGTTAVSLMDSVVKVRGREVLRKWHDKNAPEPREDAWPGGGRWQVDRPFTPAIRLDRNAQYLSAVNGTYLPLDALPRTGPMTFDATRSGYWLVQVPDNPEPRLPHPCGTNTVLGPPRWCTTPTVALLAELGCTIEVADSWTLPRDRCRRALDRWYEVLRDTRAKAMAGTDQDSAALMAAVRDCYSRGISHLGKSHLRRWYRPDWKETLYASARVSMWRVLYHAGQHYDRWPTAIRADAVTYEQLDAPKAFKIGEGMGQWKVQEIV